MRLRLRSCFKAVVILVALYCFFAHIEVQAEDHWPSETLNEKDNLLMILIPAGPFTRGLESQGLLQSYLSGFRGESIPRPHESPESEVKMAPYYIDKFEISNYQYRKFLNLLISKEPHIPFDWGMVVPELHDNLPIVGINWSSARAYCEWAGKRLPTEAEWEKAARGTSKRYYPWGNDKPTPVHANFGKDHVNIHFLDALKRVDTNSVHSSPYGVVNMAGNAREWVSDYYSRDYYERSKEIKFDNPKGPSYGTLKVTRGGSWKDKAFDLRTTARYPEDPNISGNDLGFRCAKNALNRAE